MLSYAEFMKEGYYDSEETHEEHLTTNKGLKIKVKVTKFPQINDSIAAQAFIEGSYFTKDNLPIIIDKEIEEGDVANAQFRKNDDGTYYAMNAVTNNNLQKHGIMTALYNFVEEKFGVKIVPSKDQDPGGKEFWKKRYIKENYYSDRVKHLRKESPLLMGKAESSDVTPLEGCCSLIISKPYPDGLKSK